MLVRIVTAWILTLLGVANVRTHIVARHSTSFSTPNHSKQAAHQALFMERKADSTQCCGKGPSTLGPRQIAGGQGKGPPTCSDSLVPVVLVVLCVMGVIVPCLVIIVNIFLILLS